MENLLQRQKDQDRAQLKTNDSDSAEGGKTMAPPPFSLSSNPLPPDDSGDVMQKMSSAFGADFSGIQLKKSSDKAVQMKAKAFTDGNEIHFAPGEYNESTSGQQLLGHELAHVVQQRQGRVSANNEVNGQAINDDPGLEREADVLGARAARGEKVGQNQGESRTLHSKGPAQLKSYNVLKEDEKNIADGVLEAFEKRSYSGKRNGKKEVIPPSELVFNNVKYSLQEFSSQTTRRGETRTYTYIGENNYEISLTRKGKNQPSVGNLIKKKDGNLKISRTDNFAYYWIGEEEDGIKLGMNPKFQIEDESMVPEGFHESHVSGKNGVRYFKKVKDENARKAAPSHQELLKKGYGTWTQEAKHSVGKQKRKDAGKVMGVSATQYAGHMGKTGISEKKYSRNVANNVNYEWCHLIGHGDGGNEVPENFVVGTHYANTEQLALETAIRTFRNAGLTLKVNSYVKGVREGISVDAFFGDYVRFTVEYDGEDIFSHIFDLHSGSFDIREWNILQVECQDAIMEALESGGKMTKNELRDHKKSHKTNKGKVKGEAKKNPTNKKGKSNLLFESENWGELSENAYQASKTIRSKVDEVRKVESEKKKKNGKQKMDLELSSDGPFEFGNWNSGFPQDPYFSELDSFLDPFPDFSFSSINSLDDSFENYQSKPKRMKMSNSNEQESNFSPFNDSNLFDFDDLDTFPPFNLGINSNENSYENFLKNQQQNKSNPFNFGQNITNDSNSNTFNFNDGFSNDFGMNSEKIDENFDTDQFFIFDMDISDKNKQNKTNL